MKMISDERGSEKKMGINVLMAEYLIAGDS
jgi:hypothetical protein